MHNLKRLYELEHYRRKIIQRLSNLFLQHKGHSNEARELRSLLQEINQEIKDAMEQS